MTTQPLFYKNVVPLNKEKHSKLSLAPIKDLKHTRDTNSVYIAAIEFTKAAKEYPIVFAKSAEDEIFPVVLLGLKDKENLFLDKKGEWLANYIPAYVRRYPFILASGANQEKSGFAVCIDEGYAGFNTKNKGTKLFDDNGKESELLQNALKFLKEYHNHIHFTKAFCAKLDELGLLEPMQAKAEFRDGKKMSLRGFMGISRNKLKALEPAELVEMVKENYMDLVYAHLNSLDNLQNLLKRVSS